VWHFPLRKLAAEYGISDVGLAKICRKLEIPLPCLGHWTKIACGHSIPRPPLPPIDQKYDRIIVITDEQAHDRVPGLRGRAFLVNPAFSDRTEISVTTASARGFGQQQSSR
jgi:hypothetical protein